MKYEDEDENWANGHEHESRREIKKNDDGAMNTFKKRNFDDVFVVR